MGLIFKMLTPHILFLTNSSTISAVNILTGHLCILCNTTVLSLSLSFKGAFYVLCFENLGQTSKGKLPLNTEDNLVFSLKILKTHTTPWTEHLPLEQQSL